MTPKTAARPFGWTAAWSVDIGRWIVPVVLACTGSLRLVRDIVFPYGFAFDARLYTDASRVWLAGGDPWTTAFENGYRYAAPPPNLLLTAPFTVLPSWLAGVVIVGLLTVLAMAAIRSLGLPAWWILWTPILDGILIGSPDIAAMTFLILAGGRLSGLSVFAKVYAVLPMVGERRWRQLAVAGGLLLVSAPLLPWGQWLAADTMAVVSAQSMTTSVWPNPVLWAVFAVGLLSLGLRRAGYLAVPILWPWTQAHYVALALPVVAQSRILAVGFAFALIAPWAPALAVALYIAWRWRRG